MKTEDEIKEEMIKIENVKRIFEGNYQSTSDLVWKQRIEVVKECINVLNWVLK